MHKINPLLSMNNSNNNNNNDSYPVIDTDNTYYHYILKKERNQIYRNINELSQIILESYTIELNLLKHQYQDRSAFDALSINFKNDRSYLIGNLYQLFPIGNSIDRWKTDVIKDSVNKIAFNYGDCQYLVKLCDINNIIIIKDKKQQNIIFNICVERFINNLIKYKREFMYYYFIAHQNDIEQFLYKYN